MDKKVYLDFDGTVVEHAYPLIGKENVGWKTAIQILVDAGYFVILNTYRANLSMEKLSEAYNFIYNTDFKNLLNGTNFIVRPFKKPPPEWNLDDQIKNGQIYLDDISKKIPLKLSSIGNMMVDWEVVNKQLIEKFK